MDLAPDTLVLLSRIQFAFTISFHIIFPAFTIGLSAFIATLLIAHLRTGREHYCTLARFWTKIFAVSFAMGVVSGIVLSYQFGTNWSRFSVVTGNVIGPLIGYEVLTAFFLEATFLGIMLFGGNRVPKWLHVLSAVIVAFGTSLSAFWILSANSWMQTPGGLRDARRHRLPGELVPDRLQPELPVPLRPHVHGGLPDHLARGAGGRRALPARGPLRRGRQDHDAHGPRHGRRPGAAAARHRRLARPQHRQAPARQGGRDGGALGRHQARRPRAVRLSRREGRAQRLRDRDPEGREPDPHARPERAVPRPQGVSRRGPAAGVAGVLRLPHHGRHRRADARHRARRRLPVVARPAVRHALVSAARRLRLAARLHRHPRRLDGHRDRPPALDRARRLAHRRRHLAGAHCGGRDLACLFVLRLLRRVLDGHLYISRLLQKGPTPTAHGPDSRAEPSALGRAAAAREALASGGAS